VIRGCATRGADIQATDEIENQAPDKEQSPAPDTTWITSAMVEAYTLLHLQGDAHSVEVRLEGELVGGLYGVHLGGVFWGESMFHRARDASKVALLGLAAECRRRGIALIDAQFRTDHLASLGGCEMPRGELLDAVRRLTREAPPGTPWRRSPQPACKVVQDSPDRRDQD
jgi:leucyl/phenylalanyl-tRNA--protein transferase